MVGHPLRIAVVGAGRISKFHFAAWKATDGVAVVAICDSDEDRARQAAEGFPGARTYASVADLIDKEEIDALDIVTPPESHAEILRMAAARGVDCLCQKPLSRDFAEAEAVIAEVGARIRLMVNENRRYLPYVRRAREWIAAGLVGEVRQAAMTALASRRLGTCRPLIEVVHGSARRPWSRPSRKGPAMVLLPSGCTQ